MSGDIHITLTEGIAIFWEGGCGRGSLRLIKRNIKKCVMLNIYWKFHQGGGKGTFSVNRLLVRLNEAREPDAAFL